MTLANARGFVDGIFQNPSAPDGVLSGGHARLQGFRVRNTFLEVVGADSDGQSVSEKAATEPGGMLSWPPNAMNGSMDRDCVAPFHEQALDPRWAASTAQNADRSAISQTSYAVGSTNGDTGLKSLGSASHPDGCMECHFHVFSPNGCRAGRYCNFCHELHPRANAKKNRRFMKRLVNNGLVAQEGDADGSSGTAQSQCRSVMTADPQDYGHPKVDLSRDGGLPPGLPPSPHPNNSDQEAKDPGWVRLCSTEDNLGTGNTAESSHSGGSNNTDSSQKAGHSDFICLQYSEGQPLEKPLTMVAGVHARFPARIEIASKQQESLKDHIEFMADPALPEGLTLDAATGLISGVPLRVQEAVSIHEISITIDAIGPGNVSLGTLALTSCRIGICIRESSGPSEVQGETNDRLSLRYTKFEPADKPLTFVAGVRVHFPARVDSKLENRDALLENIEFMVEPPLPGGLVLHKSTGLLSGVPLLAQESPSIHNVSIRIAAIGFGGAPLGTVVLTTCKISIRILDLHCYVQANRDEVDQIVLKFRRS